MNRRVPSPTDVLAALDGVQSAIDALRALIVPTSAATTETVAADSEPQWTTLANAAALCRVHPDTMANRARVFGLGWRAGGRDYRIDMVRVRKWEQGRPFERLPADVPKEPGRTRKLPDDCPADARQIGPVTRRSST